VADQARPRVRVRGHGYPRDRLEIIVVDSASTDGTAERARRWARTHPDLDIRMVEEPERRGKAVALNAALAMA
jgi:biofilm PGA synthesis N-glycosyltransferase PgaC